MLRKAGTYDFLPATFNDILKELFDQCDTSLLFTDDATLEKFTTQLMKSRSATANRAKNYVRILQTVPSQLSICTIEAYLRTAFDFAAQPSAWTELSEVDWAATMEDPRYANAGFLSTFDGDAGRRANKYRAEWLFLDDAWDDILVHAHLAGRAISEKMRLGRVESGDFSQVDKVVAKVQVIQDRLVTDVQCEDSRDRLYMVSPHSGSVCRAHKVEGHWKLTNANWGKSCSSETLTVAILRPAGDVTTDRILRSNRPPARVRTWLDVMVTGAP